MKIKSIKVKGYKNLKDETLTELNISNCDKYVALIGLNGSGKSNIIEAISLIFHNLKAGSETSFNYKIEYSIDGNDVSVEDDVMKVKGRSVAKRRIPEFLPKNIIASYSGEELRMWEGIYIDSYSDFFQDIKQHNNEVPFLLYINKFSWSFALISLLCSDKPKVKSFVKNVLKIEEDVHVKFTIDDSFYGLYESNDALSLIRRIVDLQNDSGDGSIHINELRTLDIGQRDNADYTKRLFYYLFITGMPVRNEKIKAEKIIRKTEIRFNGIDIPTLSEGEKKLILIYAITNLLSDEDTILLLDEPDAHVHIERKKEIIDIITAAKCFTIFSTHSPKILHSISDENIRIVRNTDKGLEIIFNKKLDALSEITNGEFTIVDATIAISTSKDILLVEGTNDYNYIMRAKEMLSPAYDNFNFHIINCGGADNVPAVLEQSLLSVLQKKQLCLCTFDFDQQGTPNYKKITELAEREKKKNIIAMYHPKVDGAEHAQGEKYLLEEYFPLDAYRNKIIDQANASKNFKTLDAIQKAKAIIQDNYLRFSKESYKNFKVFFDKAIAIQKEFHNPSKAAIPKKVAAKKKVAK